VKHQGQSVPSGAILIVFPEAFKDIRSKRLLNCGHTLRWKWCGQ